MASSAGSSVHGRSDMKKAFGPKLSEAEVRAWKPSMAPLRWTEIDGVRGWFPSKQYLYVRGEVFCAHDKVLVTRYAKKGKLNRYSI